MEKEKEKEKSVEPWDGRRILGVAAAVAAGAFFLLSSVGDSSTDKDDQSAEDTSTRPRKTMKGPGSGRQDISRDKFNGDAANYFQTLRQNGPKAAVDKFQ